MRGSELVTDACQTTEGWPSHPPRYLRMPQCSACKRPAGSDSRFCSVCGTPLPPPNPAEALATSGDDTAGDSPPRPSRGFRHAPPRCGDAILPRNQRAGPATRRDCHATPHSAASVAIRRSRPATARPANASTPKPPRRRATANEVKSLRSSYALAASAFRVSLAGRPLFLDEAAGARASPGS